jgi:hypothetical protein
MRNVFVASEATPKGVRSRPGRRKALSGSLTLESRRRRVQDRSPLRPTGGQSLSGCRGRCPWWTGA